MFKGPFLYLGLIVGFSVLLPMFLPFSILVGFPVLVMIGLWSIVRFALGKLPNPAETAAVWLVYLGILLTIQGILICFDTALAGAPPTVEEKAFGTRLAYVGGCVALTGATAAFVVGARSRLAGKPSVGSDPLE